MIKTKNFHPKTDLKLKCTCLHPECDRRSVSQETLDRVQLVRDKVDRSLYITSGGRCPYHPNEVHRTTPADHQKCQAVDVAVSGGYERAEIVKVGLAVGFNAIGVAKTFVHLGYRPELVRPDLKHDQVVMWVY